MSTEENKVFDQARSEAFTGRMVEILNSAALALMTSIGHQVGLFDTMAGLTAATSEQIARKAGLQERYVREWLGAMTTGRMIDHDPNTETYTLRPEHAAWLTRAAGTNNLALQAQYIPLLAQVEQDIVACMHKGGGVPYSAYPRFQQIMAEESGAVHDAGLIETILPLVPGLVERLYTGINVLDVGCGRGHAINLMAQAFPNSQFLGLDFSEEGIATGRAEAERLGLSNAHFEVQDVARLDSHRQYDLITAFDAIHDQAHPATVLQRIATALSPNGVFLMVDIKASSKVGENLDHVLGPFLYTVSCMHCMTVSLAYGGDGLGTMWGEQLGRQMLADAGFTEVVVQQVPGDLFNNYFIARISSVGTNRHPVEKVAH
jgi:2-polyprenyl-3-methyl-5-hydroxy-6-metoxy-1,4-benzoquinol methylase